MTKKLRTKYGLPLVNIDNIWEIVQSSGMANWKTIANPIAVEDYPEFELNSQEKEIKHQLRMEVVQFLSPDGEIFKGFRLVGGSGTRVFTLLNEELIPICAEFQHGCGEVLFDLPGGGSKPDEKPAVCAKREFEEEIGIILKNVVSLSSVGMPITARHHNVRNFSFMGIVSDPVELSPQKLDANEYLKAMLINLDDWLKLIEREVVQAYSVSTTLLAIRRLQNMGKLRKNYA